MKKAEQYFYDNICPKHENIINDLKEIEMNEELSQRKGFQEIKNLILKHLSENKLKYSNQLICNIIMNKIIKEAPIEIKSDIENIFIGFSSFDDYYRARAYSNKFDDESLLISIHFRLYNYILILSRVFSCELIKRKYSNSSNIDFSDFYNSCFEELENRQILIETEDLFNNLDNEDLKTELNLIVASIFESALTFIMLHEIGHHCLKHMSRTRDYFSLFFSDDELIENRRHKYEYKADLFAYELFVKTFQNHITPFNLHGCLISFLAIALLTESPSSPSDLHPSVKNRFNAIISKFKKNYSSEHIDKELFLVYDLCNLLFEKDLYKEDWWKI